MKALALTPSSESPKLFEAQFQDKPKPKIRSSHGVLVKISSVALAYHDIEVLKGHFSLAGCPPRDAILGSEFVGTVAEVGKEVTNVQVGDDVIGLIAGDSPHGACAEYCLVDDLWIVKRPPEVNAIQALSSLYPGIAAYTALHTLLNAVPRNSLVVLEAASPVGLSIVKLAEIWGLRVLAVANVAAEIERIKSHSSNPSTRILNLESTDCLDAILQETGGQGVDYVVEARERLEEPFTKHEIISSLAVGGRWVSSQKNLQLDPPHAHLLYLKGASLSFLFPQGWLLSSSHLGRFQHILNELVQKFASNSMILSGYEERKFDDCLEVITHLEQRKNQKFLIHL